MTENDRGALGRRLQSQREPLREYQSSRRNVRCHICKARCEREVEPACGGLPALTTSSVWTVAMGNGLYVDACQSCWQKWPWDHRLYPPTGFGHVPKLEEEARERQKEHGGTAPGKPADTVSDSGRSDEKAAALVGVGRSRITLEKLVELLGPA